MEETTLILVTFDMECPKHMEQNETLKTVAEYQHWDDDTFSLLGMRCELKEGGTCLKGDDCVKLCNLPETVTTLELVKQNYILCEYGDLEGVSKADYAKMLADCRDRYKLTKTKASG